MDEHTVVPSSDDTTGRGSRRALLAAGTTAALGAVGVALARPAAAAAGQPVVMGASNSAASTATSLTSGTTGTAFGVTASNGHALIGIAKRNTKFGVLARNDGTTLSAGGAILGDGKVNSGLVSRTSNRATYGAVALNISPLPPATGPNATFSGALLADGGTSGAGVVAFSESPAANAVPAIYAEGTNSGWGSWIFGDEEVSGTLFARFSRVGTETPAGTRYREAVSGDTPQHTASGVLALDASGNGTVTLPQTFVDSAQLSTAAVLLTAMGTAMPNLAATVTASGFTVSGGAVSGRVSWQVVAPRHVPGAPIPAAGVRAAVQPGRTIARSAARAQRVNPAFLQG